MRTSVGFKIIIGYRKKNDDGFTYNYGGRITKYGPLPHGKGKRSVHRSTIRCIRADKRKARRIDKKYEMEY